MLDMINIDKLILAFKIRLQYHNCEICQFDKLTKKLEEIDRLNDNPDMDFVEDMNTETVPYKFGKTELKRADLTEIKTHFKHNYWVTVNNIKIALLQWETYGNSCNFGYMNMLNNTLYSEDWKLYKQAIRDLKLSVSHISKLDIAFDSV